MNMNDELDMLLNETASLTDEELLEKYENEYEENIKRIEFKEKELSNNFSEGLSAEINKIKERQEFLTKNIEKLKLKTIEKEQRIRQYKSANKVDNNLKNSEEKFTEMNQEEKNNDDSQNETVKNLEKLKFDSQKLHEVVELRKEKIKELEKQNEIDESLSKTIELPKINVDDEITVEEIKEKSKQPIENEVKKIGHVSVIYTAKNGTYTVNAIINGKIKSATCMVNGNLINANSKKDLNLFSLFEIFDKENGTNLKQLFDDDKLDFRSVYDFRRSSILDKTIINSKQRRILKDFAKKESKLNENTIYIKNMVSKKKASALIATAAILAAGGMGAKIYNDKSKELKNNDVVIESTTEDLIEDNKNKDFIVTESNTTEEKTTEDKKEQIVTKEADINIIEEEPDIIDYRVGDKIKKQENIDLYYSYDSKEPMGSTSSELYKNVTDFEITYFVVTHDGKRIETITDNSISYNELREKYEKIYGDDFNILYNSNGLDINNSTIYRNCGWAYEENLIDENKNVNGVRIR